MSEKSKFAKRLNDALDAAGVPKKGMGRQSKLVKMMGVSHRSAKRWLEGEEFPMTSKLVKLSNLLGVRSNWLLSGQGGRHPSEEDEERPAEDIKREADELNKEAFDMLANWMKLPEMQRQAIRRVIQELARVR